MKSLACGEKIKYSVDELLKTKPKQLEGLEIVCDEVYSIYINDVCVFAETYEIAYGENFVVIRFYNKKHDLVASFSAVGSTEHGKPDECFIIGYNSIVSETSLRVMNDTIE